MEMFDPREYIPQFRLEIELKETWKKKASLFIRAPRREEEITAFF